MVIMAESYFQVVNRAPNCFCLLYISGVVYPQKRLLFMFYSSSSAIWAYTVVARVIPLIIAVMVL